MQWKRIVAGIANSTGRTVTAIWKRGTSALSFMLRRGETKHTAQSQIRDWSSTTSWALPTQKNYEEWERAQTNGKIARAKEWCEIHAFASESISAPYKKNVAFTVSKQTYGSSIMRLGIDSIPPRERTTSVWELLVYEYRGCEILASAPRLKTLIMPFCCWLTSRSQ